MLRHWIPLFGIPSVITSDRGSQFTSSIWSQLCAFLGIVHSSTTSFHPQSNGLVEHFHCQLKVSLRARLAGSDWFYHLPLVLLGLCNVPRDDSAVSAAEVLLGTPLALPGEFLNNPEVPSVEYLRRIQQILKNIPVSPPHHLVLNHEPGAENKIPTRLLSCSHVFVREDASKPPLALLYRGPYLVLNCSSKFFSSRLVPKLILYPWTDWSRFCLSFLWYHKIHLAEAGLQIQNLWLQNLRLRPLYMLHLMLELRRNPVWN